MGGSVTGFGARLRTALGVRTVRWLESQIGVSGTTVYSYLMGRSVPTLTRAEDLARVLGVRLEWLAFGSGQPEHAGVPEVSDRWQGTLEEHLESALALVRRWGARAASLPETVWRSAQDVVVGDCAVEVRRLPVWTPADSVAAACLGGPPWCCLLVEGRAEVPVGWVTVGRLAEVASSQRACTPVDALMHRVGRVDLVDPQDKAVVALQRMAVADVDRLVVCGGPAPAPGLVTWDDLVRAASCSSVSGGDWGGGAPPSPPS